MKKLAEKLRTFSTALDEEERKEAAEFVLDSQAENLWVIGSVGMTPRPVVTHEDIKNIPETGIIDWPTRVMKAYMPVQWYFDR